MARTVTTRSIFTLARIPLKMRFLIALVLGPLLLWSPSRIRNGLLERGFRSVPTVSGIKRFCLKFRETGSIKDKQRRPKRRKVTENMKDCIHFLITQNRDITNVELRKEICELFGVKVKREVMRRTVLDLGWKKTRTRYCQFIRQGNKLKRLVYSMNCILQAEDYRNCIFTDETTIQLTANGNLRFRHCAEETISSKVGKPKHPYKVHIWGGISCRGPTPLVMFTGNLNAVGLEAIFQRALVPFLRETFPDGHRFLQDNDPKHTSKRISEFMRVNNVLYWKTPPESPDLNPIEMVWADLKRYLSKQSNRNAEDLLTGSQAYWDTLTAEKCCRYIGHLKKVLPKVVIYDGGPSGH